MTNGQVGNAKLLIVHHKLMDYFHLLTKSLNSAYAFSKSNKNCRFSYSLSSSSAARAFILLCHSAKRLRCAKSGPRDDSYCTLLYKSLVYG